MADIRKEIEFWSLIMRDHALFQFTSLSPKEQDVIKTTDYYKNEFEKIFQETQDKSLNISPVYINNVKNLLTQFIQFKKILLTRLMKCDIQLAMTPSLLNHMINEAMEYYQVLSQTNETRFNPTLEILRLHNVWLPDASGHAKFLVSQLDAIEAPQLEDAYAFMIRFDQLFKKAHELALIYERIGLDDRVVHQFNRDVEKLMNEFVEFLSINEKMRHDCNILTTGSFSALMPNHMIREENYYIYRIKSLEK